MNTRVVPVGTMIPDRNIYGGEYAAGWNDCRNAFIAAAPPPEPANDQPRFDHREAIAYAREMGLPTEFPDPSAHLREQIADAQARQARGEGIPGDAELAHYDENHNAGDRRVAQRDNQFDVWIERGPCVDRRQNAAVESPVPAAPASTLPTDLQQIDYWFNRSKHAEQQIAERDKDIAVLRQLLQRRGKSVLPEIVELREAKEKAEATIAEKDREIARLTCYFDAWMHWRSLQTGDMQKMLDAAIRCESAEAELAELRRGKS